MLLLDVTLATTTATREASTVENSTVPTISTITDTDRLTTPPSLLDPLDTVGDITVSMTTLSDVNATAGLVGGCGFTPICQNKGSNKTLVSSGSV